MASINSKIENALSDLVSGNIYPLSCPLEEKPDEFIVYNPEFDAPAEFGDNRFIEWNQGMQIHWCKRGISNYLSVRKTIRNILQEAGFDITGIRSDYDEKSKYTQITFSVEMLEDDLYG